MQCCEVRHIIVMKSSLFWDITSCSLLNVKLISTDCAALYGLAFNRLYGVVSQKAEVLMITSVRI